MPRPRICAYRECAVEFVPRTYRDKFCSKAHRKAETTVRRAERRRSEVTGFYTDPPSTDYGAGGVCAMCDGPRSRYRREFCWRCEEQMRRDKVGA